jgi:hypothetical protein
LCGVGVDGGVDVPLVGVPLVGVPLVGVPLVGVPLVGVPLVGVPLVGVPLVGVPLVGGATGVPGGCGWPGELGESACAGVMDIACTTGTAQIAAVDTSAPRLSN